MGKPYAAELAQLPDTYAWAMQAHIVPLVEAITGAASLPLLATGSGGSLTAAHVAVALHQRYARKLAKAVTPLELVSSVPTTRDMAVLFVSAGGRNADILGALQRVVVDEPRRLMVLCSRSKSPLSQLAETYRYVDLFDFTLPSGKDGFLATNSLLAFVVLLCRAYTALQALEPALPATLADLVHPSITSAHFSAALQRLCLPLWARDTIVVLYGPTVHPATVDLESKFTEAALGSVQMADYRNFAHGRHHWLAKRGDTTAVLALVTNDNQELAEKTLRLIPADIPVVRLDIPWRGSHASLAALATVLYIVGCAGEARGIDPGRPVIPLFGRKLYNLRAFGPSQPPNHQLPPHAAVAITRKTNTEVTTLVMRGEDAFWRDAYQRFCHRLHTASLQAVICDYDGTLCDPRDRYTGLSEAMVHQLRRLLEAGLRVGIATGRGKSVKEELRRSLEPRWWSRVVIGYYNGAEAADLDDDLHPNATEDTCDALRPLAAVFQAHSGLAYMAMCTYRRMQITVEPKSHVSETLTWDLVQQLVNQWPTQGITVVRSSHSIDVLAPGISKTALVEHVRTLMGVEDTTAILCIGDRGRWPGNDFALLQEPCSLSVDEVSLDPHTCWNLAPAGYRGVQATLHYLEAMHLSQGVGRMQLAPLGRTSL